MKKHITATQLDEFLELRHEQGKAVWNKPMQLSLVDMLYGNENYPLESDITIGKMIEILNIKSMDPIIQKVALKNENGIHESMWEVLIDYNGLDFNGIYDKEELVDALWEAVKYILEKENNNE